MYDDLELPDCLNRKVNPRIYTEEELRIISRTHAKVQKLVWPKRRNWRKIEERRRRREKAEEMSLKAGSIVRRKGQ